MELIVRWKKRFVWRGLGRTSGREVAEDWSVDIESDDRWCGIVFAESRAEAIEQVDAWIEEMKVLRQEITDHKPLGPVPGYMMTWMDEGEG